MSAIYRTLKRLRASPGKDDADKAVWTRAARERVLRKKFPFSGPGVIVSVVLVAVGALSLALVHVAETVRTPPGALTDSPRSSGLSSGGGEAVASAGRTMLREGEPRMFQASFPRPETARVTYAASLSTGRVGPKDPRSRSSRMSVGGGVVTVVGSAGRPRIGETTSESRDYIGQYAGEDVPEGYSPPDDELDENPPEAVVEDGLSNQIRTDRSGSDGPESSGKPLITRIDQVARPAVVIRLVSRIERALALEDMEGADSLIRELVALKGTEDSYALKLRAFWYMRQGDFDKASPLLLQVLEKRPNDLEAGINMAIADINRGRFVSAKERLVELRQRYPAHETVARLIGQIGG